MYVCYSYKQQGILGSLFCNLAPRWITSDDIFFVASFFTHFRYVVFYYINFLLCLPHDYLKNTATVRLLQSYEFACVSYVVLKVVTLVLKERMKAMRWRL